MDTFGYCGKKLPENVITYFTQSGDSIGPVNEIRTHIAYAQV